MISPITAPSLTHPSLAHGFFTRQGGVSQGLYASLNTGYGSGDDKDIVKQNRQIVLSCLGSKQPDIITCHQVHSNIVHSITKPTTDITMQGDALVTNLRGFAIGVLTADCVPVLFADMHAGIIGAAHAGWKGTYAGILEQTITAMGELGAKRSHIYAAIGPHIAQASYEVGHDLYVAFTEKNAEFSRFFVPEVDGVHYRFDVGGVAADILQRSGIAKVDKLGYDTYADASRFFSFRRATHQQENVYGRQISAIMLH